MGYKQPRTIYRLTFEDPRYEGLEIRMRSLPLGQYLDFQVKLEQFDTDRDRPLTEEDVEKFNTVLRMLAACLVDWNLEEEDGRPLPTTFEVLADQEYDFLMDIIGAFQAAVAGVSEELGKGSGSGETSPAELELPMEPLSPSRAS